MSTVRRPSIVSTFVFVAVATVLVLWILLGFVWPQYQWPKSHEQRAAFGETFGAVNSLFAGLAFAGLIWAILLQRAELELQRQELRDTRAELAGQK